MIEIILLINKSINNGKLYRCYVLDKSTANFQIYYYTNQKYDFDLILIKKFLFKINFI